MTGRSPGSSYDMTPALLDADALTGIARSRGAPATSIGAGLYRRNISALLAHIAALEQTEHGMATPGIPRVTAAPPSPAEGPRVRREMPSPGTPAFSARMRELRAAGAVPGHQ